MLCCLALPDRRVTKACPQAYVHAKTVHTETTTLLQKWQSSTANRLFSCVQHTVLVRCGTPWGGKGRLGKGGPAAGAVRATNGALAPGAKATDASAPRAFSMWQQEHLLARITRHAVCCCPSPCRQCPRRSWPHMCPRRSWPHMCRHFDLAHIWLHMYLLHMYLLHMYLLHLAAYVPHRQVCLLLAWLPRPKLPDGQGGRGPGQHERRKGFLEDNARAGAGGCCRGPGGAAGGGRGPREDTGAHRGAEERMGAHGSAWGDMGVHGSAWEHVGARGSSWPLDEPCKL